MTLLKGGEQIVPGISVETFPGHTAHMMGILVRGDGNSDPGAKTPTGVRQAKYVARACYISDLIPTTAHLDITWGMGFDLYPLETIQSKKQYYAKAISQKWLTIFTHDPKIPWAYVEKDEAGKMVARGV